MASRMEMSLAEKYPEIYAQQNIDRRGAKRVVPMEILSLGLGRTGTLSMKAAYEILGYPAYHWISMMENPSDMDLWLEALGARYFNKSSPYTVKQWDALLGHVSAVCDSPINAFGPELIEAYPNAKVVLVERDIEKWYHSFDQNVIWALDSTLAQISATLDPGFVGKQRDILQYHIMPGQWGAKDFNDWRRKARDGYREHYALIKKLVPKERLLVYELGSGWEPLCKFLGRKVPDVPFPHVNETEELKERVQLALMMGFRTAATRYARIASLIMFAVGTALLIAKMF